MKILLVEDEPKLLEFLKLGLNENGYVTETSVDGLDGERLAKTGNYAVIILDVNLPTKNGFEICSELRKNNIQTPVLMLTALSNTENKLHGFEVGADDYLAKPFEFLELLARIKSLIKRNNEITKPKELLRFADIELDLSTKTALRGGNKIVLTAKEFLLLEYFLKHKNRVISRSELAQNVWDIDFDTGTNVIDVYVNFLRKKIDKNYSQKLIHTQVGFGYILKEDKNENKK